MSKVEDNSIIAASQLRWQRLKQASSKKEMLLELQAIAADWEAAAPRESAEAVYRQAVGHGINLQYETMMITEEPAKAKEHQFWADTEAARADACLALLRQQSAATPCLRFGECAK